MLKEIVEKLKIEDLLDAVTEIIDRNNKAFDFFDKWVYSDGPVNDERYRPDKMADEYLFDNDLTETELKMLLKEFKKKGWK